MRPKSDADAAEIRRPGNGLPDDRIASHARQAWADCHRNRGIDGQNASKRAQSNRRGPAKSPILRACPIFLRKASGLIMACSVSAHGDGLTGAGLARMLRIAGAVLCLAPAALVPAAAVPAAAAPGDAPPLWQDDFAGGAPRPGEWARCALPWDDQVGQCSALQAGPGEQVYWSPAVMGGGRDPVVPGASGGIALMAWPLADRERALRDGALARAASVAPRARALLADAGWASGWLQTRRGFPLGTTITARLRPGAGPSSWGGLWMLNDPAHRRWPPEIDVAEVTNDPDGRMRVRQVIHFRDAKGTLQTAGCPYALMPRDWITASVTRVGGEIRFGLNGVERCRIAAPPGFDDPMTLILSQQVGGLARPTGGAGAPFGLEVRWIRVTRA